MPASACKLAYNAQRAQPKLNNEVINPQPYTQHKGTNHCPEAAEWADKLGDELVAFARDADDSSYAQFSFRAVLMGFFRAMLFYVMNGCQWDENIERFATWTVKYDLWCKMRFFRDMMHNDLEGERTAKQRGPVGLLPMLPKEFTREEVKALRIAQGMKPDPKNVLIIGLLVVT